MVAGTFIYYGAESHSVLYTVMMWLSHYCVYNSDDEWRDNWAWYKTNFISDKVRRLWIPYTEKAEPESLDVTAQEKKGIDCWEPGRHQ